MKVQSKAKGQQSPTKDFTVSENHNIKQCILEVHTLLEIMRINNEHMKNKV